MDEEDVFDESGMQVNDINTLTQLISQEVFGYKRTVTHDQDDDQAHYFNTIKAHQYTLSQFQIVIHRELAPVLKSSASFPVHKEVHFSSITYDVVAPPPWPVYQTSV